MPNISNNLSIAIINTPPNNTSSLSGNNSSIFNNRNEAIDYIKNLTQDQYSSHFDPNNTIGKLKGEINIPLRTLELDNGEKQYYVTANMDPRNFFYLEKAANNIWDINMINIQNNHTRQVVFIFGANLTSDTLPVNMKLTTEKVEEPESGGVFYVYCNPAIKFSLHELKFDNDEIKQKSDLINSFKLDSQRKEKLIDLLRNCSSGYIGCSHNDAIELCKEFPNFFKNTDEITSDMQINTFRLAKLLAEEH